MAIKSVTAAIASVAIVIGSTNFAAGQGNSPAGSGDENGAATATTPSSTAATGNSSGDSHVPREPARLPHKKKQSFGDRLKSSFQKKLQKYLTPKKNQHSIAPKTAPPGRVIPQGQIE
jgi:hypothetical protein